MRLSREPAGDGLETENYKCSAQRGRNSLPHQDGICSEPSDVHAKGQGYSDRGMKKKARFATLVALSEYFVAVLESYKDRMRA